MKRRTLSTISAIIFLAFLLLGCGAKDYANYDAVQDKEYVALQIGEKVYVPFSPVSPRACGRQIGIVSSDEKDKVYEYNGLSSDEWIVNCYDDMGDTFMLLREINVTDYPEGMESEYEWNKQ